MESTLLKDVGFFKTVAAYRTVWCLSVQVLRWYGYFKEAVTESAVENFRVRKVVMFFYLEDNSCQVVEPKEDNSGLPQVAALPCPA